MRQFYGVNIPGTGDPVVVHFDQPVRKVVEDLTFWRYDGDRATNLTISVEEYGTDGDNAYFE